MPFTVGGYTVSEWSNSQTHEDFYNYTRDGNDPQARGLGDKGVDKKPNTAATYLVLHHYTEEDTYGLVIWHRAAGLGDTTGKAGTTCVNLAGQFQTSGFVFEGGQGIKTGTHGEHDFTYAKGEPVTDNDVSALVHEAGTGLGFRNVTTLAEDEPQDFQDADLFQQDSYTIDRGNAIAEHLFGWDPGDGVMWGPLSAGTYSFELKMHDISRDSDGDYPAEWIVVGPNDWAVAGTAGEGTSVTVEIDV